MTRSALRAPARETDYDRSIPLLVLKIGHYPLHHGGLGAIRSMGRVGVPVYAMTEDRFTPAACSRYLTERIVAPTTGREPAEQLLELLAEVGRWLRRPAVVLPTDDEAAVFLAEHASELGPRFIMPAVPASLPRTLASKRGLHDTCVAAGIPTARATFPCSFAEVKAFACEATFPVVVKNVEPFTRLATAAVSSTTIVQSADELLRIAEHWPQDAPVMLQEYIPDDVGEDWIFHGYFDAASSCLAAFTGVKYRSWPPRAGVTTYGRTVANAALADHCRDLCRKVGYQGIVDLDIRFDHRDGVFKLLDFNPRVGAQFRLFETDRGIDVVRAMHLDLTGRTVPEGAQVEGRGLVVEHLDAAAIVATRHTELPSTLIRPARGRTVPAWFAADDLVPFVVLMARSAGSFPGFLARRRKASITV